MSDYSKSAHPETCLLFAAAGIDPNTVIAEGIDETGYATFVLDTTGARTFNEDGFVRIRHSWPLRADVTKIIETFVTESVTA